MIFILPIGIAFVFWIFSKNEEIDKSTIVWHLISILGSLTLLPVVILTSRHFICLDGPRSLSFGQLFGNIILSLIVVIGLWIGLRNKNT